MTEIKSTGYLLWIRAGKPTFGDDGLWFFRQEEALQEHFAELGDMNQIERILATSRAIHDPDGFEALHYSDQDPETTALQQMAAKVSALLDGQDAPVAPAETPGPSMAGVIQRREAADAARIKATGEQRPFLGRLPDSAREDTG